MKLLLTALVLVLNFTAPAQLIRKSSDTVKADARLLAATIYYGSGAELTHETKVNINSGVKQIVIQQLSTSIDENSLQISVPEDVTLLSHRFSVFSPALPVFINPLVKKMQDSMAAVNTELRKNSNLMLIEEQTLEKTGKLIEAVINTAGNKTVSSEDALKLINAYTLKIEKAQTNIFNLKELATVLIIKRDDFQTKIYAAAASPEKIPNPYGQLVLQVICKGSGSIPVSLSYFTKNAGWTPSYDIKVKAKTNEIRLVYKAAVMQRTGIDWEQTKLTLSTGNPSLGGVAPLLNAWYLQFFTPELYSQMHEKARGQNSIPSTYRDDRNLKDEVVVTALGVRREARDLGYSVTTVDPSTLQNFTTLTESQLNTNFEIDLPYDIESDGQLHSVTIKEEKITAILKNYAVPKLDKDAYLLAEVHDWQTLSLLPGSANIIMDDTYLGKTFIDPNITNDTLNLTLGKDRRVAVKRTLIKDFTATKTNGNSTVQTFTYEIAVKNNKSTSVDLLLKDQYPISMIKEIEVTLTDAVDAKINKDNGVLTWQVELKPGESRKLRFSYSIKYPKDKKIANL